MNSTLRIKTCVFIFLRQQIDLQVGREVALRGGRSSEASCLMMKGCSALERQKRPGYVGRDEGAQKKGKENSRSSRQKA